VLEDKYGKTYPKKGAKKKKNVREENLGKIMNTNKRELNNVSSLTY